MIKNITGNWFKSWSSNSEAGRRVYEVEHLLSGQEYTLAKNSPVCVFTNRIILNDEMLQNTREKNIWDIVTEKIKKTDRSNQAGNLHGLIWDMRNLKPEWITHTDQYFFKPGEIRVSYENNKSAEGYYGLVTLVVKTVLPLDHTHLDYCNEMEQVLFDWGSTNKLVVEVRTLDNEFGKEILKVAHKK